MSSIRKLISSNIHLEKPVRKLYELKPFLGQESIEFFKVILNENLSLLNFIDSDFVGDQSDR